MQPPETSGQTFLVIKAIGNIRRSTANSSAWMNAKGALQNCESLRAALRGGIFTRGRRDQQEISGRCPWPVMSLTECGSGLVLDSPPAPMPRHQRLGFTRRCVAALPALHINCRAGDRPSTKEHRLESPTVPPDFNTGRNIVSIALDTKSLTSLVNMRKMTLKTGGQDNRRGFPCYDVLVDSGRG